MACGEGPRLRDIRVQQNTETPQGVSMKIVDKRTLNGPTSWAIFGENYTGVLRLKNLGVR